MKPFGTASADTGLGIARLLGDRQRCNEKWRQDTGSSTPRQLRLWSILLLSLSLLVSAVPSQATSQEPATPPLEFAQTVHLQKFKAARRCRVVACDARLDTPVLQCSCARD